MVADDPSTGDLDVTGTTAVTIIRAATGTTTITAGPQDRAFAVGPNARLELDGLAVTGGQPGPMSRGFPNGGAVYSAGTFTANREVFSLSCATPAATDCGRSCRPGRAALSAA